MAAGDEMGGGVGPTPEAPGKVKLALQVLEQYFESIEEPFHATQVGLASESETSIAKFVVVFVLCLVPIIPVALSKVASWVVGSKIASIGPLHFRLASFWDRLPDALCVLLWSRA
jgi:hypothetical protein